MSKFLTKSEEYELMWERTQIKESNVQPINVLLESKHMLENIVKTINNNSGSMQPIKENKNQPSIDDVVNVYDTLLRITKQMGVDTSLQPVI
jgi:hypothetical protein